MPTRETIKQALSHVLAGYDVSEAYVYGSYARGDQNENSDIDLRLLCGDSIRYGDLYRICQKLEELLGRRVDILTCRPDKLRPAFYDAIKDEEVKVYACQ